IGTIFMCSGMFWCAALIGESTEERLYRQKDDWKDRTRLFWLQPGNQIVGDETFDAFAYVEDLENKPILEYTTSIKKKTDGFYPYTWIAVVVTVGGYIAQFIGLRGMNASVSIAQLGITLLMSFLRGCLRMRRLRKTDNKLAEVPDMVVGHELDWLALHIA